MWKWIASGVVALGLMAPLAAAPTAQAAERQGHHRRHECFEVMCRRCGAEPWLCHGRYDCREEAEHAEHHLRERGFEAFVRPG